MQKPKAILLIGMVVMAPFLTRAQVQVSRQVIGSTGTIASAGNLSISFTVGETAVATGTAGSVMLTQGFQQPSTASGPTLVLDIAGVNATCLTAADGYAYVTPINGSPPYTYQWEPEGGVSDTTTGIKPGEYIVKVTDLYGNFGLDTVIIDADIQDQCDFHIYTGVTPNGDGDNDIWIIDGINLFPDNSVMIFNRWGNRVWQNTGYNNNDVAWSGLTDDGTELPDGTYYYLVQLGGEIYKGWVQLTR